MGTLMIIICFIAGVYFIKQILESPDDNHSNRIYKVGLSSHKSKDLSKKFSHVTINSHIEYENLPLPVVHYPKHGGGFISFSQTKHDEPYLCSCSERAVVNCIALHDHRTSWKSLETCPEDWFNDPLSRAPLGNSDFPDVIAKKSLKYKNDPIKTVKFKPHLCHRCNEITPSFIYPGENSFQKSYGWYIIQNIYRSGVMRNFCWFLPNVCPKEIQDMIHGFFGYGCKLRKRRNIAYYVNASMISNAVEIKEREIFNFFENETRKELGFKKIGDGWISETTLYSIICQILPNEKIIRHYRPDWLNGLELDIYIPRLKTGIEYQGQQHFIPIEHWGGEKAFRKLQKRDMQKAKICEKENIRLITIDYDEPLTEKHIRSIIEA